MLGTTRPTLLSQPSRLRCLRSARPAAVIRATPLTDIAGSPSQIAGVDLAAAAPVPAYEKTAQGSRELEDSLSDTDELLQSQQQIQWSRGRNSGGGLSTLRKPKVQILSIGTAQPSEKITPPEIISQLTARSTDFLSAKDQRAVQVRLQAFFQSTKLQCKPYSPSWSDIKGIQYAFAAAVEACDTTPEDIDLVLYCGCNKGFLEPSQAPFVTNALRIPHAHAFDVTEACAGFARSLEIADLYLSSGRARTVAIVSATAPPEEELIVKSVDDLSRKLSSLTVSCCATATIVGRLGHQIDGMGLELVRNTDSLGVTMGSIPTKHFRDFLADNTGTDEWVSADGKLSAKDARAHLEDETFTVFSGPLFASGRQLTAKCLGSMSPEQKDGKVFVTHSAATDTAYAGLGIPEDANHLNLYSTMGNCADSTLPLSIATGVLEGRLQAGDQISFVLPASGNTCVAGCVHLPAGTKAGDSISLKEGGVILNSVCLSEHHLDTVGVLSSLASLDL